MKKPNIDNEAKRIMVDREAYSELIEALIEANRQLIACNTVLEHDFSEHERHEITQAIQTTEQALIKAGCEL